MIKLGRHIEILLLDNDRVIVPQFGGFTAHYVNAQCEVSTNFFYPPLRTLGFNPQLTINDSLLAQSYIEAYDISYPEAIRRIEGEVEETPNGVQLVVGIQSVICAKITIGRGDVVPIDTP